MEEKKISILIIGIIIMIGIAIVLAVQFADPVSSPYPPENHGVITLVSSLATTPVAPGTTVKAPDVKISRQQAQALLDEGEIHGYSIAGITLTDRYPGKILYEFSLVPDKTSFR